MATTLPLLVGQIRRDHELDRVPLHPDVNEKELEEDVAEREDEDLRKGAVLKGVVEAGEGDASPGEGDLIFLHLAYADESGKVYSSTRTEHEGAGVPEPFVLGKDPRLLRGVHLALDGAKRGERSVLTIQPQYAFAHKECSTPPPVGLDAEQPVRVDVQLTHWYPRRGVRIVEGVGGLYKRILQEADSWESPRAPFEVAFKLRLRASTTSGKFEDGDALFASDLGTVETQLGDGALPAGIERALESMKIGEKAVFSMPTSLLASTELVPVSKEELAAPRLDAWLELVDFRQVRDLADDGGVIKRILKKGDGLFPMDCPVEDSRVVVHWRIKKPGSSGWAYDSRTEHTDGLTFDTGMKIVPDAVDLGVRLMLPGEIAHLTSTPKYAYEGRTDRPQGIAGEDSCEIEVELLSFKTDRNWQRATAPERLDFSQRFKEQGNTLYKQGEYKLAKVKYLKAAKAVDRSLHCDTEEQQKLADDLLATTRVNLAQCAIKQQEFGEALFWSNKAIEDRPDHAKAFLRHGVALSFLGDLKAAAEELEYARALDPKLTGEVTRELAAIAARERAGEAKAKSEFGSFFKKK